MSAERRWMLQMANEEIRQHTDTGGADEGGVTTDTAMGQGPFLLGHMVERVRLRRTFEDLRD